jgi:hypothetical protein
LTPNRDLAISSPKSAAATTASQIGRFNETATVRDARTPTTEHESRNETKEYPMSERFVRNNAANPMNPIPVPKQVPAKRGLAKLPGRKIFYADTGGEGEAVVFLHPAATGDLKVWAYQHRSLPKPAIG